MGTSSTHPDTIRPDYQLASLGSPAELRVSGRSVPFTNAKHLALLTYLAMEPDTHGREHLTRFVWSAGAPGSMDTALSELRAVFGPEVFPHRVSRIALPPGLVEVDALTLLSAIDDPSASGRAVALYRGPFLEGFNARGSSDRFVRWVERTRGRLDAVFRELCERECLAAEREGDWRRVLETASIGLRKSPGWEGGERWREVAEDALRSRLAGDHPTAEVQADDSRIAPRSGEPSGVPAPVPAERRKAGWSPALRIGAAVVLVIGAFLLVHGDRAPELVRMPPIRAEELPAPGSPIRSLSDWVRTDGQWIYYRYERYMPAACRHRTVAVGNFGPTGWTRGTQVACLNAAWLAVDGARLIERFSLAPETTYCLQFLYIEDRTSHWGQHGPQAAPGLDSIRVVAPSGAYNIGFAITPGGTEQRHIELTNRFPGSPC